MGLYDICFGTAATLIACLGMYYVKNVFDYNLKSDVDKNKKKIMEDIIENNRNDINEIIKDKKMYDVKYFDDSLKNGILLKNYLLSKSNEEIILMIREYQNLSSKHQAESNRLVISLADLIFVDKETNDKFWINSAKQLFIGICGIFLEDYQNGLTKYNQGYHQYQSGLKQYEEGYRQYQSGYNTYLSYENQVKQYDESLKTIEDQINQLGGLEVVKNIPSESPYYQQCQVLLQGYDALKQNETQINTLKAQLPSIQEELSKNKAVLDSSKVTLDQSKEQLDVSKKKLDDSKALLDQTGIKLANSKKQLNQAKNELETNYPKLEEAKVDLEKAKEDLEEAKEQVNDLTDKR